MPPETVAALLQGARRKFERADIATAALDARLLLQAALGLDHADIIAQPLTSVSRAQSDIFALYVARRERREPVSKILGIREFYGRSFKVVREVLDPRPDTETLVELCLAHFDNGQPFRFVDLGCGSGAIGITLAAERPLAQGVCVDVSAVALEVTRHNALALGVETRLSVVESNWLESLSGPFDLMVSNPPYIASGEISELAPDVQAFDPLVALDGGADGLGCYRAIALTAGSKLSDRGVVAVEIGAGQEGAVVAFFREQGFILKEARQDLGGVMRALLFGRG